MIWQEQSWISTVAIGQNEDGEYSVSFGYKKRSRFGSCEVGKKVVGSVLIDAEARVVGHLPGSSIIFSLVGCTGVVNTRCRYRAIRFSNGLDKCWKVGRGVIGCGEGNWARGRAIAE